MYPIHRTARTDLRTAAHAFLALPAGLAATALTLLGQPRRAARLHARLTGGDTPARTTARSGTETVARPGSETGTRTAARTGGRTLARTVLGLPLDLLAFVVIGYAIFNSVRNLGYPIWYLHTDYHHAWGGPTMAGVWTVHAAGWLLCLAVLLHWPVRWLAKGQRALDRRLSRTVREESCMHA
ncbi:hypothetical protein [Streptomyces sp. NPDC004788]